MNAPIWFISLSIHLLSPDRVATPWTSHQLIGGQTWIKTLTFSPQTRVSGLWEEPEQEERKHTSLAVAIIFLHYHSTAEIL